MQLSRQDRIRRKGEEIFAAVDGDGKSIFNKDWWYGRIMDWSMKNEHFKVQMFRFVDVLPYLNSGSEVARHLKEYFAESGDELPSVFNVGAGIGALAPGLMAGAIRKNVTQMAKLFITGETPAEALEALLKARKNTICSTVDLLGEATLSEKEAAEYQGKYLELIEGLAKDADRWSEVPQIDRDKNGPLPRVNVSVKLSSLYSQINVRAWDHTKSVLKERLRPIFRLAQQRGVFINLDMEQYALKDITLEVFSELIQEPEFRDYPHWGCVIQAYLRDSHQDVQKLVSLAKTRKVPFTVRLVKGAYWDYETIQASQKGWPVPVYLKKAESDANYEKCAATLLEGYPSVRLAMGSHNIRSLAAAMVKAEELGLDPRDFEIQMLFGMADGFKRALVRLGYRVREYAPVGELIPGMAYLVRRLLENTSNESFLRSKFSEGFSSERLLADPAEGLKSTSPQLPVKGFFNEPLLDFALMEPRQKMLSAIDKARRAPPLRVPVVINGRETKSDRTVERRNPSHPDQVVAEMALASLEQAETAARIAEEGCADWRSRSVEERAQILEKAADIMVRDRYALNALEVVEVGKTWAEADGDITEAVDFCRYYAQHMRELGKGFRAGHILGEQSHYEYWPKGVALVIAPWNFPLAILCGQVVSALVTGNTVIMKPAEQSPAIAYRLYQILVEAGVPPKALQFLPGLGEEVGAHLVRHKSVDVIAFTGSKAVGLEILSASAHVHPGQKGLKRCIIEMGGKNALIIDSDADMDEAIAATLYSAFGFQGQKCSANSRLIVLEENYDRFMDRLIEAASSLKVSFAEDPLAYLGPVVDPESQQRILKMIEVGRQEGRIVFQGQVPDEGYFVPPTIIADIAPDARLAREEIFGPVLAVIKVQNMDEAIRVANGVEYGLTGGVFSRSPANIQKVKQHLEVGNLYINRGITGAMVERHPFGGFKMSGIGSKTGGPDYLRQFLEPRVVTENMVRRGFAPMDDFINV